jgi:uncharacterized protein YuzE
MEISYDTKADAIYIKFCEGKFVKNKEVEKGIILDMGEGDKLLGIEILEASSRFSLKDISKVSMEIPLNIATT